MQESQLGLEIAIGELVYQNGGTGGPYRRAWGGAMASPAARRGQAKAIRAVVSRMNRSNNKSSGLRVAYEMLQ